MDRLTHFKKWCVFFTGQWFSKILYKLFTGNMFTLVVLHQPFELWILWLLWWLPPAHKLYCIALYWFYEQFSTRCQCYSQFFFSPQSYRGFGAGTLPFNSTHPSLRLLADIRQLTKDCTASLQILKGHELTVRKTEVKTLVKKAQQLPS